MQLFLDGRLVAGEVISDPETPSDDLHNPDVVIPPIVGDGLGDASAEFLGAVLAERLADLATRLVEPAGCDQPVIQLSCGAGLVYADEAATVRHLWPYLRHDARRLAQAAGLTLTLSLIEIASPLLVGAFVDTLLRAHPPRWPAVSGGPIPPRWWIVALLLAGAVLHGWLLARQGALAGRVGEAVARRLRNALWDHLQHLPVDYIRQRGPGRLLLRFISDTRSVQRLVTEGIIKLTQELLLGVGVLAALAWLNWRMATAVLVILPIYFLILRRVNPSLRKESRATRRRRSRLSAHLNERIGGIVAVKAAARHRAESRRVRRLNRAVARRGTRLASVGARLAGMAATVLGVTGAIVLALAGREVDAGRLTGGALVAFYALLALLLPVFRRLIVANRYFQEARISVDRLRETLAEPRESEGLDLPRLNITEGLLRLEGISFAYNGGPPVLRDVNLEARRGRLVAIVGSNGAGKSTLLDLILRFRRPSTGRITIDGHDIEAVSLASLRSRIGLVTQDAPVFDGTLAENVDYGHRERDGDPAPSRRRAAVLAGLDRVVDASPLGWESPVGPGGRYLSAGQRQRLALARALASDPPLLVLDEATSALDAETEETLAITLKELARHKTVIVAAHRPATLRLADDIYVLGDGRIVEHGCHQALIAANGSYARLFAPQPGP